MKQLTNQQLLEKTKSLAQEERKIQVELLQHLKEIERRKLFLEIGYGSLYDYVIKELGYSEGSATRRIQAMRLLKDVPELENKIVTGEMNLTTAAQVQTFIRAEVKRNVQVSVEDKKELIAAVESKSSRGVEKHLLSLTPDIEIPKERVRQITQTHTEIKLSISNELKEKLDQLKLLLSHVNPGMNYTELYDLLATKALKQLDPAQKKPKPSKKQSETKSKVEEKLGDNYGSKATSALVSHANKPSNGSVIKNARYVSAHVKKTVWIRDRGCCSFVDRKTHRKCGSKFQIQMDHVQPFALGGTNTADNLRLFCAYHNRLRAEVTFMGRKVV